MNTRNIQCASLMVSASRVLPASSSLTAGAKRAGRVTGRIDLTGMTEYHGVKIASGADISKNALLKENNKLNIEDYGAVSLEERAKDDTDTHAVENTEAINKAIRDAAAQGGGTVVVPKGTFRFYTIRLESNVNLYLSKDSVVQAAKPTIVDEDGKTISIAEDKYPDGRDGNYDQPEIAPYAGLQDGGHTYFANSLFYGADKKNIMIYGDGLIDGSQMNDEGTLDQVLQGGDPPNARIRTGKADVWYGNKGISLVRCEGVVLDGFKMLNCGHFAIITAGGRNQLVDGLIVDTNRDAYDIDCTQDVTIENSTFNSLTDDAIVFKASYGAGIKQPVHNCLVRNCTVSGYDAGSVMAGAYTTDKQVATDLCGPTARIKFGTESTNGYDTVTITDVAFKRSRGFCIESVDGAAVHDIIMVNAEMDTVSSSPIFIRLGNRGRYPVTGNSTDQSLNPADNVRVTNTEWILPLNSDEVSYQWTEYPIKQYFPAYRTDNEATMPNGIKVKTVNQTAPAMLNPNNYCHDDSTGKNYAYVWNNETHRYDASTTEIPEDQSSWYGNAVGYESLASAYNICVANANISNVDPRYPIILAGMVGSRIRNVIFQDIDVTYRGGLRMRDAVEQQQLNTDWEYTQYMTTPAKQTLPWLVNAFFCKNAALLPRVDWDASVGAWKDDPYNVPEMDDQYPEPSNFGILPAYGLYARHVDGLKLENVHIGYEVEDGRHTVVLDDCHKADFSGSTFQCSSSVKPVALVTDSYKRRAGFEYVLNEPYQKTACSGIEGIDGSSIAEVTVNAPEPSTPKDSLYGHDTIASAENGFGYGPNIWAVNGHQYSLPVTVYRPFLEGIGDQAVKVGDTLMLTIAARNPAAETSGARDEAASDRSLVYSAEDLPDGATFDPETHVFTWTPSEAGTYKASFSVDDGAGKVMQS